MGYHQRVTVAVLLNTLLIQSTPQFFRCGFIDKGDGQWRNLSVSEYDIPVQIAARRWLHTGPLVSNEGSKLTLGCTIVVSLGSLLGVCPRLHRGLSAQGIIVSTHSQVGGLHRCHVVKQIISAQGPVAVYPALPGLVALQLWRITHVDFTVQLGMIRYHGKIQWSLELHSPQTLTSVVKGLNADALAPGESVGLLGRSAGSLSTRIERETRVHMQIPEKGLHQRFM